MSSGPPPTRVGELRPSQLLWAFGVGAVVDLPNVSVEVLGLDDWDKDKCVPIGEERLHAAVKKVLGPQVERLLSPPVPPESDKPFDPFGEEARIGVPVVPFPQWFRCPLCQKLGTLESRLFEFKPNPVRSDRARYVHSTCPKSRKPPTAVPARFVAACSNGHVDDFPWRYFVHRGPSECSGQLEFYEVGASLETANLFVRCTGCGVEDRSMVDAFGDSAVDALPACRGRHPHLRAYEAGCEQQLRALLLGASNGWFPDTMTVLSVPTRTDRIEQLVEDEWLVLQEAKSADFIEAFRKIGKLPRFGEFSDLEVWEAIEAKRARDADGPGEEEPEVDLKTPEWQVLKAADPAGNRPDFRLATTNIPKRFSGLIDSVVLVERLREVNALLGFTRIQPPGEADVELGQVRRAPLARGGAPKWVPGTEVRGEGIFLRFDPKRVEDWGASSEVSDREQVLIDAHRSWREARKLEPLEQGFPGALFIALHSVSHVLMRELALECGYNAASIRERIYASAPDAPEPMAGVLIYTAAPDSEGTLGGLVALGRPQELGRLLDKGLERARLCSSDPLCSEHDPNTDGTLHGAACHACLFAPETSCEVGNRYLDRALVVPTFRLADAALVPSGGS